MWTEDCASWAGKAVDNGATHSQAKDCSLSALTPQETMRLLNGTVTMFIGDSTARRAGLQLSAFLQNSTFQDLDQSEYHSTVTRHIESPDGSLGFMLSSQWMPHVANFVKSVMEYDGQPWRENLKAISEWSTARKVFVLQWSTWDLKGYLSRKFLFDDVPENWVSAVSDAIKLLKSLNGVDPARDTILFRLPIAEDCAFSLYQKSNSAMSCDGVQGLDPVNERLLSVIAPLQSRVAGDHPDVGLIDTFSWTVAEHGGVGRHKCAPADEKGTHFSTVGARMAYIQQVLHGIKLFSCDKQQ